MNGMDGKPMKKMWMVLTTAILSVVLFGCPPKTTETASATAGTEGEIVIGEYGSMTGGQATFGVSTHNGIMLALDEINGAGGVNGRKIRVISEDDQSKAEEAASAVTKLISQDNVVAIIGEVASSSSLAAAPICQNSKVPMITPSSTNPKVTEVGDYISRICFIDPFQGTVMAKFAKDTLKLKQVAVLYDNAAPYSDGLATYFREKFTADGGTIITVKSFSSGDKDFKPQLTAIKAANPQGIFVPCYYTEAAAIVVQARQLGINVPIFGGDGWEAPELLTLGLGAMEGTFYSTHYSAEDASPAVQNFVSKFKAKNKGEIPDAMAALGYDSVYVLADAIKRAGTTESAKLRDAIAATKDFEGVTGKTTIDANRNATKSAVIITIKDGKFRYVQTISP